MKYFFSCLVKEWKETEHKSRWQQLYSMQFGSFLTYLIKESFQETAQVESKCVHLDTIWIFPQLDKQITVVQDSVMSYENSLICLFHRDLHLLLFILKAY